MLTTRWCDAVNVFGGSIDWFVRSMGYNIAILVPGATPRQRRVFWLPFVFLTY